ncbi:MAG TPA: hypothetical protein VMH87_18055, partial [Pseudomonadales bacterium]|nr:hypothetical protein [Pseudomonadales bacterium]
MKKIALLFSAIVLPSSGAFATSLLSDNFNSYTDGNLAGQGPWVATSGSTATPPQVSSGVVQLGSSGEDVYAPLSSVVNTTGGGSLFIGLDLDVLTAQATGDYFLHVTTTVGGTSGFYDKLEARSSGTGFQLGIEEAGSDPVQWGSTVLSFGTTYRVVTEQDF